MACHLPSFIVAFFITSTLNFTLFAIPIIEHLNARLIWWVFALTQKPPIARWCVRIESDPISFKFPRCWPIPFHWLNTSISHHLSLSLCKIAKVSSKFKLVNGLIRFFRLNNSVRRNYLPPFAYFLCKITNNKLVEKVSNYPLLTKWENAVNHAKNQYCCSATLQRFSRQIFLSFFLPAD